MLLRDGWKLVANYTVSEDLADAGYALDKVVWDEFDSLTQASAYEADDAEFYIYDGVVLFQEGVENRVTFDSNLIIITPDEKGEAFRYGDFNVSLGANPYYAYAWVDGELKYVPINTDAEIYPSIEDEPEEYINKVATYSVDGDGRYTIKLLGNAYDDEAMDPKDYIGLGTKLADLTDEKDDTIQVYGEVDAAHFTKRYGSRFHLTDVEQKEGWDVPDFDLTIGSNSVIVVRNEYPDDDETVLDFKVLTLKELTQSIEEKLTNIQYVVVNDPDYVQREDLVLFFAELVGEKLSLKSTTSNKAERIVKMLNVQLDENRKYYYEYTVFNPYTGTEETYAGSDTSSSSNISTKFTFGDVVTIAGGKVDESENRVGTVIPNDKIDGLYWIVGYDAAENAIEVMEVPADGDDSSGEIYYIDVDGVAVTKIGDQTNSGQDMVRWGSISTLTTADLGSTDRSLKAAKTDYVDDDGGITTVYAKYPKAYIQIEWENDDNHSEVDERTGFNGTASFVTIIANNGESEALCDLK